MAEPPSESCAAQPGPLEVVLVGGGARAQAWLIPLRRSPRLRAVGQVTRSAEQADATLPRHRSLEDAIGQHPNAAFAVALPPRAGLDAALQLAAAGRTAIVQAPLHDALCDAELGPGAARVRVAHGWVTLAGLRIVQAAIQKSRVGRLRIAIGGLPEESGGDLDERLVHALALVRALLPDATAATAQFEGSALRVSLRASTSESSWTVGLHVLGQAQRLAVGLETPSGASGAMSWEWQPDREHAFLAGQPLMTRATSPGPVRALAQLLGGAAQGDDLADAAAVLRLARSCRQSSLPIGARRLRQSASIAQRRPGVLLDRLGLRGELGAAGADLPAVVDLDAPHEPAELWAFRAGLKPVAFLTVEPSAVDATLALFGEVACERRERRVQIDAQDRWTDTRADGEPRVELYISRHANLARRAAHLQAEGDPSQALRELGALCGYPPCCVAAFAAQDDRANNSRNRYFSYARTVDPTDSSPMPWPWGLNNLHTVIVPFYPCSYRCERALAWAGRVIEESGRTYPRYPGALRAWLARPVLYFDHEHQLVFDGHAADDAITYRAVAVPSWAPPELAPLAAAIGGGDRLVLDDRQLVVQRAGEVILRLERTDPALGFIAPFG